MKKLITILLFAISIIASAQSQTIEKYIGYNPDFRKITNEAKSNGFIRVCENGDTLKIVSSGLSVSITIKTKIKTYRYSCFISKDDIYESYINAHNCENFFYVFNNILSDEFSELSNYIVLRNGSITIFFDSKSTKPNHSKKLYFKL